MIKKEIDIGLSFLFTYNENGEEVSGLNKKNDSVKYKNARVIRQMYIVNARFEIGIFPK